MPPIQGRRTSGTTDAAVGLLVVFQHGDQGARHAQPRAVQGVHQAGLAAVRRAVFDVGAARLEIGHVRHRRNFQPFLQPGAQTSRS